MKSLQANPPLSLPAIKLPCPHLFSPSASCDYNLDAAMSSTSPLNDRPRDALPQREGPWGKLNQSQRHRSTSIESVDIFVPPDFEDKYYFEYTLQEKFRKASEQQQKQFSLYCHLGYDIDDFRLRLPQDLQEREWENFLRDAPSSLDSTPFNSPPPRTPPTPRHTAWLKADYGLHLDDVMLRPPTKKATEDFLHESCSPSRTHSTSLNQASSESMTSFDISLPEENTLICISKNGRGTLVPKPSSSGLRKAGKIGKKDMGRIKTIPDRVTKPQKKAPVKYKCQAAIHHMETRSRICKTRSQTRAKALG